MMSKLWLNFLHLFEIRSITSNKNVNTSYPEGTKVLGCHIQPKKIQLEKWKQIYPGYGVNF